MMRILVKGSAYYNNPIYYMEIYDYGTAWKLEQTVHIGFRIIKLIKTNIS